MKKKYAFVDESGDESMQLELPGISNFYVVCAILVGSDQFAATKSRFAEIKQKYFPDREMKSAGAKDAVRARVLQDLAGAEFSVHLLIGNKAWISMPGLRYPKSFIKFLHKTLYAELANDHAVEIVADRIKNPAFMKEMKRYLDQQQLTTLWSDNSYVFADSKSEVCIQAADFIAGSVRDCFERNQENAMRDPLMAQIRTKVVNYLIFPEKYGRYIAKIPGALKHDQIIEARAVAQAEEFLRNHGNSDEPERELQCIVLRKLLKHMVDNDADWVSTEELMTDLNLHAESPITEQAFRGIIGHLRDADVLIASRHTKWGYKIPGSLADLTEFLNRQNTQLVPMINRIRNARDIVLRATDNSADILATPGFENLKAMVDAAPLFGNSRAV